MAKLRLPVDFDRPVSVEQVPRSVYDATLLRFNLDVPYSATDPVYIGPASNEAWEIESVKLELQTSANVGNRNVYYYVRDRYGALSRYLVDSVVAGSILYHIMGPNLSVGGYVMGNQRTSTGPSFVSRLDFPCQVGAFLTNFDGGTDVCNLQLLVREVTQL